MIEIPVFQNTVSNWRESILLEDKRISFRFMYNIRNNFFHIDFTDAENNTIYGIKVVENFPLLKYKKGFVVFDGDIFLLQKEESDEGVTYENLGVTWALFYLTPDEVVEWEDENGF
jgi:hypothetical protein